MFKLIFLQEHWCIVIQISLKFIPNDTINNKQTWFQVMVWCLLHNNPESVTIMT